MLKRLNITHKHPSHLSYSSATNFSIYMFLDMQIENLVVRDATEGAVWQLPILIPYQYLDLILKV